MKIWYSRLFKKSVMFWIKSTSVFISVVALVIKRSEAHVRLVVRSNRIHLDLSQLGTISWIWDSTSRFGLLVQSRSLLSESLASLSSFGVLCCWFANCLRSKKINVLVLCVFIYLFIFFWWGGGGGTWTTHILLEEQLMLCFIEYKW